MLPSTQAPHAAVPSHPPGEDAGRPLNTGTLAVLACGLVAAAVLWLAPLDWSVDAQRTLAVFALMIAFWLTEVIPYAVTGLIGCYLFWALGLVDFGTAFGGFASPTPWFLFAALLLGRMTSESGLARRLAGGLMASTGGSYSRVLLAFVLLTFVLSPLVPSGLARVAILSTVALGVLSAYESGPGSRIGRGLFLVLTYTALIWDKTLISGAGTILARGLIEKLAGVRVYWSEWLLAFLPVSALTVLAFWRLTMWLYPPEQSTVPAAPSALRQGREADGWTRRERKGAAILLVLIGLWLTDVLHHIPPEMVAIGVGLAAFLPGINVLGADDLRRLNMVPVIFAGTALSLAGVLAATGASAPLASAMFAWMEPLLGDTASTAAALYWSGVGYHLIMPNAQAMLSTSLPPLLEFGSSHDLDPRALGMIWTFASGPSLMLYQSGIIILGHSYGYFDARDFVRFGLALTLIEFVLVTATAVFFWPLVGLRLA